MPLRGASGHAVTPGFSRADTGGIYNTYRIPFGKGIRITMYRASGDGVFWYIVRGVTNYPLVVGDLQLPANTRLALYKNENVMLAPLQYLPLVNASNTAGMVLQVTIQANSTDFNYLEACVRAYIDGDANPVFLSSGVRLWLDQGLMPVMIAPPASPLSAHTHTHTTTTTTTGSPALTRRRRTIS